MPAIAEAVAPYQARVRQPDAYNVAMGYFRAIMTVFVVAGHSWFAYDPTMPHHASSLATRPPWWLMIPVYDTATWIGFSLYILLNSSFGMALFFFVSGLFVWSSLERKGPAAYLKRRLIRLGIPFVAIAAAAPAFYYPAYLQGGLHNGFWHQWISLGFWASGHAWFLWTLLAFDLIAVFLFSLFRNSFEAFSQSIHQLRSPAILAALLTVLAAVTYLPLVLHYGPFDVFLYGPFMISKSRCFLYLVYFLMGTAVGIGGIDLLPVGTQDQPRNTMQQLVHQRAWWLLAAISGVSLWLGLDYLSHRHWNPPLWNVGLALAFTLSCALSSLAALAVVLPLLQRRHPILDSLLVCSYGIYIVHYVYVVWLQYALLKVALPGVIKGIAVFLLTMAFSWSTVLLARRSRLIAGIV